jgi:pyrroloquinoline quinone biosynthesis protein B
LPAQIETHLDLQPASHSPRNTPISAVLLTNADLDHVLGLFALREGGPLDIYAPRAVRDTIASCLGAAAVLDAFCGATWHEPAAEFAPLPAKPGLKPGVFYRAIDLGGSPPRFAKGASSGGSHSVAYEFAHATTGGRLLVAPDVGALNPPFLDALAGSDAVLFDGTFWSAEELPRVKANAPKAEEMGHVTIQGCSLELLRKLSARHKIYIHINNTNPVLSPDSRERAAVEAAGIVVGSDGLEFEL